MLIQTDGGFFWQRLLLHRLSLDFRSFSNSAFSLAFVEGLLHLLSIIFHYAFTNSYRNNVLYNFNVSGRKQAWHTLAWGTPSIMEARTKSKVFKTAVFSSTKIVLRFKLYTCRSRYFSFLTCMLQFKSFYHSSFCNLLKFFMTDKQTHWQTDQSLYPSCACAHGVIITHQLHTLYTQYSNIILYTAGYNNS